MRRAHRSEVAFLVVFAPIALLIILTLLLYRAYWIPSGSMKPSLLIGDYLLVNRAAYGFPALMCGIGQCDGDMGPFADLPERGDIATFIHPVRPEHFIKRIIGLPGDEVQMRAGQLHLNGTAVETFKQRPFEETYVLENGYIACNNAPVEIGAPCFKDQVREALPNGRSYLTINIADDLTADNTKTFTVPAGHVFVMGDNRDNSLDSRFPPVRGGIGFVPLENMIGRADVILFSLTGQKGRVLTWVE
ncbi:MAG: signal peptidase I [Pseudomonadota bacterium]